MEAGVLTVAKKEKKGGIPYMTRLYRNLTEFTASTMSDTAITPAPTIGFRTPKAATGMATML
jgi:hypothetical protein